MLPQHPNTLTVKQAKQIVDVCSEQKITTSFATSDSHNFEKGQDRQYTMDG